MDLKTGDLDIETQKFLVIATTFKQLGILASNLSCVLIIRRSQISSKTGDLDLDLQAKIGIKL